MDDMSSDIIYIRFFFSQISWPLGPAGSGVDFEPKNPRFKPQTAQKRRPKFQSSTRRAEIRINFFTDSIRNQHPKLRVNNFARNFEVPKLRVRKKTTEIHTEVSVERNPEIFPKFRAKVNYCVNGAANQS